MAPQPLTPAEKTAIQVLLDDPSPSVRRALLVRLGAAGNDAGDYLRGLIAGPAGAVADAARHYLQELGIPDPVADFRRFIASQNYELESGFLLLARIRQPSLDITAVRRQLDEIAGQFRRLRPLGRGARAQCVMLNDVLFRDLGFRGNIAQPHDPLNLYFDAVMERKLGLPVSLSAVYLLVAQRAGLDLEPVGGNGYFLVGAYTKDGPFFIDPYRRGELLEPCELIARLETGDHKVSLADLAPLTVREVLSATCRELAGLHLAAGEADRSQLFAGLAAEFEAVHERSAQP